MSQKICGSDISIKLGVCALTGCKECNIFTLTIGPMSFRLDGASLNELIEMLRQYTNSEQYINKQEMALFIVPCNSFFQ